MAFLNTIVIQKIRGLQHLELKDLGKVNLLVGNNNSGKTSILEALAIYANPLDIGEWWSTASKRKDVYGASSFLELVRWIFYQDFNIDSEDVFEADFCGGEFCISVEGNSLYISEFSAQYDVIEELRKPSRKVYDPQGEDITEVQIMRGIEVHVELELNVPIIGMDDALQALSSLANDRGLAYRKTNAEEEIEKIGFRFWDEDSIGFSHIEIYKIPVTMVTPVSHRSERSQFQLLSEAQYKNFKSDIIQLLRQIDPQILDLHILADPIGMTPRFTLVVEHERLGFPPLNTFGDGVQQLFHIALKLPRAKGGFLLIDELESAIHTEALQSSYRWLVKWCADMDIQVFATTHSLEAVDALLDVTEADDQLVLYRLEPGEDRTHVVRHGWERLKILREELGQEVRW